MHSFSKVFGPFFIKEKHYKAVWEELRKKFVGHLE